MQATFFKFFNYSLDITSPMCLMKAFSDSVNSYANFWLYCQVVVLNIYPGLLFKIGKSLQNRQHSLSHNWVLHDTKVMIL